MFTRDAYTLGVAISSPTGKFPGFVFGSFPTKWDSRQKTWVATSKSERTSILEFWRDTCSGSLPEFRPWLGVPLGTYYGSYRISESGTPPKAITASGSRPRHGTTHKNFQQLVRQGEVVVSDFDSDANISITAVPPMVDTLLPGRSTVNWALWDFPWLFQHVADPSGQGYQCVSFSGYILRGGTIAAQYQQVRQTEGDPSGYDIHKHLDMVSNRLVNLTIDSTLVSVARGKANAAQYDIMAALAETPETWRSILNGCTVILNMYKDARKGAIRLENQLSRLQRIEQPSAMTRLRIAEITKAISDVWLTYRLGILPTVNMVEDLLALNLANERVFYRYRETTSSILDVSYGSETCDLPVIHRAFIKRRYDSGIESLGFSNLAAVWELVPLSFVIDRYVNIGNLISSFTTPDLSVKQGATYSWKVSGTRGATVSNTGWSYSVTVSSYRRTVINPDRYCGVDFPPKRSFEQKADHLALLWNLVLDDLIRPKKGT